jgi:xanthine dehydrogenase iron-sulfur cluster and FAD-binding subunit A
MPSKTLFPVKEHNLSAIGGIAAGAKRLIKEGCHIHGLTVCGKTRNRGNKVLTSSPELQPFSMVRGSRLYRRMLIVNIQFL